MSACLILGPGSYVKNPGDYTYAIEDGKATITGDFGSDLKVLIPSALDGAPVVAIGDFVFAGSGLQMIEIPGSVTAIGEGAFSKCENLLSVDVPPTVEKIGQDAFADCPYLTVWTTDTGYVVDYMLRNGVSHRIRNV